METLPREIINKMFLFIQHPVAELFKKEFKRCIEDMDDDENFCYQWADMKEQRKYHGGIMSESEEGIMSEYCDECNVRVYIHLRYQSPYKCPICDEIFSAYN